MGRLGTPAEIAAASPTWASDARSVRHRPGTVHRRRATQPADRSARRIAKPERPGACSRRSPSPRVSLVGALKNSSEWFPPDSARCLRYILVLEARRGSSSESIPPCHFCCAGLPPRNRARGTAGFWGCAAVRAPSTSFPPAGGNMLTPSAPRWCLGWYQGQARVAAAQPRLGGRWALADDTDLRPCRGPRCSGRQAKGGCDGSGGRGRLDAPPGPA